MPYREQAVKQAKGYDKAGEAFGEGHEIVIDSRESRVLMSIKRNESLVEEREDLYLKNSPKRKGLTDNLMIIFIDTISRR